MRLRFLVAAVALVLPLSVKAQTVYTYTGTDFTLENMNNSPVNPPGTISAPYSSTDHVYGELTFAAPLAGGLSDATVTPESFSLSDGVQTITNLTDNGSPWFMVSTDSSGDITSYVLDVTSDVNPEDWIISQTIPANSSPADNASYNDNGTVYSVLTNTNGSFAPAVSATPEPGSLALLGSGMAGLAFQVRRRMGRS